MIPLFFNGFLYFPKMMEREPVTRPFVVSSKGTVLELIPVNIGIYSVPESIRNDSFSVILDGAASPVRILRI